MHVHGCRLSFGELAEAKLEKHMRNLLAARRCAHNVTEFLGCRTAGSALRRRLGLGRGKDFRGCYVFLRGDKPVYVGVSKNVIKRICQHVSGTEHNSATFVYKMTAAVVKLNKSTGNKKKPTRAAAMIRRRFRRVFGEKQARLLDMRVAYIPIENHLELYLFEAYAAMKLGTGRWNTFATH
jgi:predicted GIY-YIG superfamily endonuclease